MTRWAAAVARCSSATVTSPSAQLAPMDRSTGDNSVLTTPDGSRPPPRRPSINHQAPALSPANRRVSRALRVRATASPRDTRGIHRYSIVLERIDITHSNPPDQSVLRGRELSRAHIPIDGHVVQPKLCCSLLEGDGLGLCGHESFLALKSETRGFVRSRTQMRSTGCHQYGGREQQWLGLASRA